MTCLPRGGRSRPRTSVRRLQAVGSSFLVLGSTVLALGLTVLAPPPAARSETILRVGVLDGSPPCSELRGPGRWQGKAVDLWHFVAARELLAYTL